MSLTTSPAPTGAIARASTANEAGSPWHADTADAALARLWVDAGGLTGAEAARRLAEHGPNRLPEAPREGPLRRFIAQFRNVLIYVLLGSGIITFALGEYIDASVIFGVVLINAVIGFIQERKAEAALAAIRGMLAPSATVLRDGRLEAIPAEGLVPGDVARLRAGDRVPADLRLIETHGLEIEEAVLTGEALAVAKSSAPVAAEAALGDRACMAFSGTLVTVGTGAGVVVATGTATEIGRISTLLTSVEAVETPLARQMEGFARWLTAAILALAGAMMLFGALVRDFAWVDMFMAAVGLAVAAIPEGLPAVVTITLAIGVTRMARRRAITRHLPTVETLGAVSVICTDKTGTLTRNRLAVERLITPDGDYAVEGGAGASGRVLRDGLAVDARGAPDLMALVRAGVLCNDAESGVEAAVGNPTDAALIDLATKAGQDPAALRRATPRLDVIPFDSRTKLMAVATSETDGTRAILMKGAPEIVLERCVDTDLASWHAAAADLAARGMRVIALARKDRTAPNASGLEPAELAGGFAVLGLLGISDPPRPEAIAAVAACREAGIRVKMITGDHAETARAIARQTGILDAEDGQGAVLTGREIDALDAAGLRGAAERVHVFARTTPEHKLRLVTALQETGRIAAMTGDGVNDSPALKRADVGVAMGRGGTEAAKEAADIVLGDDNFATIAAAVEEGRTIYANLKKAIGFILPTSGGISLIILAAVLGGEILPVTPAQILWVNMITAVSLALALSFEPAEGAVMRRPPRDPSEPLLDALLSWRILFVSGLMTLASYGVFLDALDRGQALEQARGLAVTMLVLCECAYLISMRRADAPIWARGASRPPNPYAWGAIAVTLFAQALFLTLPWPQLLFAVAPPDLSDAPRLIGATAIFFLAVELEKAAIALLPGRNGPTR